MNVKASLAAVAAHAFLHAESRVSEGHVGNHDVLQASKENSTVRAIAHSVGKVRGGWTQLLLSERSVGIRKCSRSVFYLNILEIPAHEDGSLVLFLPRIFGQCISAASKHL